MPIGGGKTGVHGLDRDQHQLGFFDATTDGLHLSVSYHRVDGISKAEETTCEHATHLTDSHDDD
jgi:hypothetical protein